MTSSWEGKSKWPGVVLGKIKSLWSTSQGTTNDGLNQLIDSSSKNADELDGLQTHQLRKINEGPNQMLLFNGRTNTGRKLSPSC